MVEVPGRRKHLRGGPRSCIKEQLLRQRQRRALPPFRKGRIHAQSAQDLKGRRAFALVNLEAAPARASGAACPLHEDALEPSARQTRQGRAEAACQTINLPCAVEAAEKRG